MPTNKTGSGNKGKKRSPLTPKQNQRRNTQAGRERMGDAQFAIPEKKKYRVDDAAHSRNALARVEQHGTPEEKRRVRAAVARKDPSVTQSKGKGKK